MKIRLGSFLPFLILFLSFSPLQILGGVIFNSISWVGVGDLKWNFQDTLKGNRRDTLKDTLKSNSVREATKTSKVRSGIPDKSKFLPIGIKNPELMDSLELQSFSDFWYKRKTQDINSNVWYSEQGVKAYSQLMAKEINNFLPQIIHGKERKIRPAWILFFLMVIILVLTFIKLQFPNDLRTLLESLFNDRLIRDDRELRFLKSPSSFLTLFSFCLSFSLLAYFYFRDQGIEFPYQGIELFGIICLGLLLFFVFKILVLWLLGKIFNLSRVIQSYLSLNYISMANFTILLVPFLLVYALIISIDVHYLTVWVPFLIVTFYIFLYIRSIIFVVINYRFSKFYLFLYFCAVEICPLLLVFKVIYT